MKTTMRNPGLRTIAVAAVLCLVGGTAQGELLLYEGFDYPAGSPLDGLSGALGTSGGWVDTSGGTIPQMTIRANGTNGAIQTWTGIPVGGFPQAGGYAEGERDNNNEANIALDPSVTARFTDGSTIWLSYVSAATTIDGMNDNHHKPNVAIGQGELLDDRAFEANGQAIGAGAHKDANAASILSATYWDDEDSNASFEEHRSRTDGNSLARFHPQQLIVAKITFGAANDTVEIANFDISIPYTTLTEADFNAFATVSITSANNLDQLTFDTLSFHGSRANYDEIRIGTTFDDVVGLVSGGPPGPVADFTARAGDSQVLLTWTNPTTGTLAGVKIQRRDDDFPTSPTDGVTVFDGLATSFLDTGLTNDVTYYYTAYAHDAAPTYAEGQTASAMPEAGVSLDAGRWTGYR